ncbi:MAG: site-specific integrase, partial [Prevotellaceae bacterium]|nr:site-specific integrase [Prevotellaceae bacterium]
MERSSYSINFWIRESKVRKDGKAPIEVTIRLNGERASFSTGKKVPLQDWEATKQQVKGNNEEAKTLNRFIYTVKNKIYQKEIELLERGFVVTANLLKDAYFDKIESISEKSLFGVFTEHNEMQKSMIGKGISKDTHWCSDYTLRLLKEHVKIKYRREDIYLRELNINF